MGKAHKLLTILYSSQRLFSLISLCDFSGLQGYPLKAGEKTALPLNFTILPEYLKNLGYRTHLIGKWHLGYYQSRFMPTERGFDDYLGYLNGAISYFSHELTERVRMKFEFTN